MEKLVERYYDVEKELYKILNSEINSVLVKLKCEDVIVEYFKKHYRIKIKGKTHDGMWNIENGSAKVFFDFAGIQRNEKYDEKKDKKEFDSRLVCELCGERQENETQINMYGRSGWIHYCLICGGKFNNGWSVDEIKKGEKK